MQPFAELGLAIDKATDEGNEANLRKLGTECESRLATAVGEDRVYLHYYQANTYSGIIAIKRSDPNYVRNWDQPEEVQNILLLRCAIAEPAFKTIGPTLACQLRTNLANRLNQLGRPVAANEQWLKALQIEPRFAKALLNRADFLQFYARNIYDEGHIPYLLAAARSSYAEALADEAVWESGDRENFVGGLVQKQKKIDDLLIQNGHDDDLDLDKWSLGNTREELSYRNWCLNECLFLNPLNDAYRKPLAAADVLHLPSHTYRIDEIPRFPDYFNLLKQEYVSARYRHYRSTHENDPGYVMRDVLMLNSGVNQALGHFTEELKSAFLSAYAILDKVGLFLNDYYQIGHEPGRVSFQWVWYEKPGRKNSKIHPCFEGNPPWLLTGLHFLSKDLFDENFFDVMEPDAANLARIRHLIEHRFLSVQHFPSGMSTETHSLMAIEDLEDKALRLLKMAREALIYLSLAMHHTENTEGVKNSEGEVAKGLFKPSPIVDFGRY